jgi:hypothetical protein
MRQAGQRPWGIRSNGSSATVSEFHGFHIVNLHRLLKERRKKVTGQGDSPLTGLCHKPCSKQPSKGSYP